jgi:putative phage-type endonuclease
MIEKKTFVFDTAELIGVFESGSEDWKNIRKLGLGGSDAGVATRCNKYSSWGKLYLEKTNKVPGFKGNAATDFGQKMEPIIREQVEKLILFHEGNVVKVFEVLGTYKSKEKPFMVANIDGLIEHPVHGFAGLEIKTANSNQIPYWENNSVPTSYMAQIQHYMYVLGLNCFYVFFLLDGNIDFRFVERNEDIIKDIIKNEELLWSFILTDRPPPANEFDAESIGLFYKDAGKEYIETDISFNEKISEWISIKKEIKKLEEKKDILEEEFKQIINSNAGLKTNKFIINWGSFKRVGFDTKKLEAEHPEIYKEYLKETPYRKLDSKII